MFWMSTVLVFCLFISFLPVEESWRWTRTFHIRFVLPSLEIRLFRSLFESLLERFKPGESRARCFSLQTNVMPLSHPFPRHSLQYYQVCFLIFESSKVVTLSREIFLHLERKFSRLITHFKMVAITSLQAASLCEKSTKKRAEEERAMLFTYTHLPSSPYVSF